VLAVLPWGAVDWTRLALPLLPLSAIHFWSLRRPSALPAVAVFLTGLFIDVMTFGPLGFWALIYLTGAATGRFEAEYVPNAGAPVRLFNFMIVAVLLAALQWAVSSAYFMRWIDWPPFISAALAAIACHAVITVLFNPLDRLHEPSPVQSLERRT
jgi:rod shape-determining protein MreD